MYYKELAIEPGMHIFNHSFTHTHKSVLLDYCLGTVVPGSAVMVGKCNIIYLYVYNLACINSG